MKRSLFILSFICTAFTSSIHAQTEQWDTYLSRYGDKPGSVLVDMALAAVAPDKKFPYLVITGPRARNCDKQGVPSHEEINELEEILSTTDNFLTGITAKVLAGTFTYKCDRLNYYYVKDTAGIRYAIGRMYARSFQDRQYTIKIKQDKEWGSYLTFLYPNEETQNWMQYNKAAAAILSAGDSLSHPQPINFRLYFKADSSRAAFATGAASLGYHTEKMVASKQADRVYGIVVARQGVIKMDSLTKMIDEIKGLATMHNGAYDGWDTPVASKTKSAK